METKTCPFCGETIMAAAKKCRYCGEWLEADPALNSAPEYEVATVAESLEIANSESDAAALPVGMSPQELANRSYSPPTAAPLQQAIGSTNVMPQININLTQQVNQEQVVVVDSAADENSAETEDRASGTGFLKFELFCVAVGIWIASTWWWALIGGIAMLIMLFIPGLGHAISVILGLGMGLLAGAVASAFHAPTWVVWVIGIIVGLGAISLNLDQRKNIIEE